MFLLARLRVLLFSARALPSSSPSAAQGNRSTCYTIKPFLVTVTLHVQTHLECYRLGVETAPTIAFPPFLVVGLSYDSYLSCRNWSFDSGSGCDVSLIDHDYDFYSVRSELRLDRWLLRELEDGMMEGNEWK